MKLRTRLILVVLFLATGVGTGYAWKANVFSRSLSENQEPKVIKKKTAVKPKNLKDFAKEIVAAPIVRKDFTFFDTLDDVNLLRYVNLKGKVVEKEDEPTVPTLKKPIVPHIIIPELPKSTPTPDVQPIAKPKMGKLKNPVLLRLGEDKKGSKNGIKPHASLSGGKNIFRVQVSSFRESDMAQSLEAHLKTKGYPAFFKAVTLAEKGTWYRVYLGEFVKKGDAQKTAELARERDRLKPVIIRTAVR